MLAEGAHAEQYYNPPGNHPSEPNYIWLEAGDNLGVTNDGAPSTNHQSTTDHLVGYLEKAGVSWKSYQEDASGTKCPLTTSGLYAPKHNPMVFFDDVTNGGSSTSTHCIDHVRPLTEMSSDLSSGSVARYNFVTPDLCNDMHGATGCPSDLIAAGDTWLSTYVPMIQASKAYADGGAIFVTWDESEGGDFPIGMIVLSPLAKKGHANSIAYTHSSTLRTMQEIFGVTPLLRDAAHATDLSDMFTAFP
jgi:phospholipase C